MKKDEKNILEQNIKIFFENKDSAFKNEKFNAYFFQSDENTNNNYIYDNKNYIHYLLNISKNKELLIKDKNENEITIIDSSYDLFFYKKSPYQNTINCILILIINDIDIKYTNENYLEFKSEKLLNINFNNKIINKIKDKIIEKLKNEIDKNIFIDITKSLIGEKNYNFLFNKDLMENNNNDNIKKQIENLSRLTGKVEIKTNQNKFIDINNLFMNVYEILSPSYKSILTQKYLSEMPINLYNLMEKYFNTNFNKAAYDNYINNKYILTNTNNTIIENNNIKKIKVKKKINKIFRLNKCKNKIINNNLKLNLNKYKDSFIKIQNEINKKNKIIKIKEKNKKNYFKIIKKSDVIIEEKKKEENYKLIKLEQNNKNNVKKRLFKCLNLKRKRDNFFVVKK